MALKYFIRSITVIFLTFMFLGCSEDAQEDTQAPFFQTSKTYFEFFENNSSISFFVYATDNESSVTYSIENGEDSSFFNISGSTGEIKFASPPNYETQNKFNLVILAKDQNNNSSRLNIVVVIKDIDEVKPVFLTDSNISFSENIITSFDVSVSDDSELTFSLSGTDSDDFEINSTTSSGLKISFISAPDYETKKIYNLTITATDYYSNEVKRDFTINILDLDDFAPVYNSDVNFTVTENINYSFDINFTDENNISYSIQGVDSLSFNIDSSTGTISFKESPDYESQSVYNLTVIATDSKNNSTSKDLIINILDVDDTPPVFIAEKNLSFNENGIYSFDINFTDENIITYSISGLDAQYFDFNESNFQLTFKTAPDFETQNIYNLLIIATDSKNNSSEQNITINIFDLDDTPPVFVAESNLSFNENSIYSFDINFTDENIITYSISGSDAQYFDFNETTLQLTFKEAPDYETQNIYNLLITATDSKNNRSEQNITINILDVDDTAPVIQAFSSEDLNVTENKISTFAVQATDENEIIFTLTGADSDLFTIDSSTGEISFKEAPDYESQSSYNLTIIAIDSKNNSATQDFTIQIEDVIFENSVSISALGDKNIVAYELEIHCSGNLSDGSNLNINTEEIEENGRTAEALDIQINQAKQNIKVAVLSQGNQDGVTQVKNALNFDYCDNAELNYAIILDQNNSVLNEDQYQITITQY
jgi:uncharacterized lipoprotein YbaY